MIPWHEFESKYAEQFPGEAGQLACSVRMALGALLPKEKDSVEEEDSDDHGSGDGDIREMTGR